MPALWQNQSQTRQLSIPWRKQTRHCERSEAIQSNGCDNTALDCFVGFASSQ